MDPSKLHVLTFAPIIYGSAKVKSKFQLPAIGEYMCNLCSNHYVETEVGASRSGAGAGLIQLPALTVDTVNDDQ